MIESLFSGGRLSDYLGRRLTQAREEIAALPADAVSDSNVDRETPLRMRYCVAPIVLDISNVQMDTPDDPKVRLGMRVPFHGSYVLFNYKPSRTTSVHPRAEVKVVSSTFRNPAELGAFIRFEYDGRVEAQHLERIKEWRTQELRLLEKWVEWTNADVEEHNRRLDSELPNLIAQRRDRLIELQRLREELD